MSLESQHRVTDRNPSDRRTASDEAVQSRDDPQRAIGAVWTFPQALRVWIRRKAPLEIRQSHFVFLHDIFAAITAFFLAHAIIGWGDTDGQLKLPGATDALAVVLMSALVFALMRLYCRLWQYTSIEDISAILKATAIQTGLIGMTGAALPHIVAIPLSALFVNALMLSAFLIGPRFLARLRQGRKRGNRGPAVYDQIPILIVGAGDSTELFLRALESHPNSIYRAVGIVDEMGAYLRGSIHGVEILGRIDEIGAAVEGLDRKGERPHKLVVTEDGLSPAAMRELLDAAAANGMSLSRSPRATELTNGVDDKADVKPVAIEDLLGRPQTLLDRASMAKMIKGARVLVTGAGGTIGSELVRQISDLEPSHLSLMDNSELHLYEIDMELSQRHPGLNRSKEMGDVRDRQRVRDVMVRRRPTVVFHAAAMKHVPMVEDNPAEGVLTNVRGTQNVADASVEFGVEVMVLISTDKAVNPTSVMGVTKRIAESYCQSLDLRSADMERTTRFVTVRFGNVLGSTGSVVPLFQRQLAAGGPLTVTDPNVTRYFMTVSEAVSLVLRASAAGRQRLDHAGRIFVLEMGEPVRIRDLANQMIRLAGLVPERDIKVVFTGLRPGEKLFEEPLHASEEMVPTAVNGLLLASPRIPDRNELLEQIDDLISAAEARAIERIHNLLPKLVPEYRRSLGTAPQLIATAESVSAESALKRESTDSSTPIAYSSPIRDAG